MTKRELDQLEKLSKAFDSCYCEFSDINGLIQWENHSNMFKIYSKKLNKLDTLCNRLFHAFVKLSEKYDKDQDND